MFCSCAQEADYILLMARSDTEAPKHKGISILIADTKDPGYSWTPIITADGWQAAGTTLTALRAIIHALRGWPTPFGAALNATTELFDQDGEPKDAKDAWQLATVAEQVMAFASMKARA